MKKLFLFLSMCFLTSIYSCGDKIKIDDLVLQENSKVKGFDEWYNSNKSRLHEVTRNELLYIKSEDLQKAIFNIIPAERRTQIWIDKLKEVSNKQTN